MKIEKIKSESFYILGYLLESVYFLFGEFSQPGDKKENGWRIQQRGF
jgi:hypothetical protein